MSGGSGTAASCATVLSRTYPTVIRVPPETKVNWPRGPYSAAVAAICAQLKACAMKSGGLVSIVPEGEARLSVIIPTGGRDPQQLSTAITAAGGAGGDFTAATLGDAVLVTYPASAEARVRQVVAALEVMCFEAEILVAVADETTARTITLALSGSVNASVSDIRNEVEYALGIAGRAQGTESRSRMVQRSAVSLCDANSAKINAGGNFVVPQKTVSPQGTVTTTGYTQVRTGFDMDLELRRVNDCALLKCDIKLSSVDGTIDQFPVTSNRGFQTFVPVKQAGYVLLASIDRVQYDESSDGVISLGSSKSGRSGTVIVLAKIHGPSVNPPTSLTEQVGPPSPVSLDGASGGTFVGPPAPGN